MKLRLPLTLMLFFVSLPAYAQQSENFRRFDIGWNVLSYARQFGDDWVGGNLSFVVRKSERLGFVADVAVHTTGLFATTDTVSYRFGPRIYARERGRLTPFAEVLAGGTHASTSRTSLFPSGGSLTITSPSANGFAMAAGGGVDMRIKPWFAWRMIEADYTLLRLAGQTSNGVRLDMGIVFRFGR